MQPSVANVPCAVAHHATIALLTAWSLVAVPACSSDQGRSAPSPPDASTDAISLAEASDDQPVAEQDAVEATLGTIGVQELHDALPAKDFLLINVHIPYEGEIPGTDAKISYLDSDGIAAFVGPDLDTSAVVYCKTDHMSTLAGEDLVARGYRHVRYLRGGMTAWTAAGYPLENNP